MQHEGTPAKGFFCFALLCPLPLQTVFSPTLLHASPFSSLISSCFLHLYILCWPANATEKNPYYIHSVNPSGEVSEQWLSSGLPASQAACSTQEGTCGHRSVPITYHIACINAHDPHFRACRRQCNCMSRTSQIDLYLSSGHSVSHTQLDVGNGSPNPQFCL